MWSNSGFFLTRAPVLAGGNHLGRRHRVTSPAHLCLCGTATASTLIALWFDCDVRVPCRVTGDAKSLLGAFGCHSLFCSAFQMMSHVIHCNIITCARALHYQMLLWFYVFAHWVDTSVQRDVQVLQLTTVSPKYRAEIRSLSPPNRVEKSCFLIMQLIDCWLMHYRSTFSVTRYANVFDLIRCFSVLILTGSLSVLNMQICFQAWILYKMLYHHCALRLRAGMP